MPVTVVVGGQFGSEGKGKVAHYLAKNMQASYAVRCGGANSGHTVVDDDGKTWIFRHLPTAAILPDVKLAICAGSYIDVEVLLKEIEEAAITPNRLIIDPEAVIITQECKAQEAESGLVLAIGSTGSGTGAAVANRVQRKNSVEFAMNNEALAPFIAKVSSELRKSLKKNERIIIEGTQGFGLSPLHSGLYPKVTSRDTTASSFISEAGLSPVDVDDIVLVIRAYPIRVAGDSGPLEDEITWEELTTEGNHSVSIQELTTVTQKERRVGRFDAAIVKDAIVVNNATRICLNHVDYVNSNIQNDTECLSRYIKSIERKIDHQIEFIGLSKSTIQVNEFSFTGKSIPPGMLSSPQIRRYIKNNYLVLIPEGQDSIDKGACNENLLKPATYDMRLGTPAFRYENGKTIEFSLGAKEDSIEKVSKKLTLHPNSLTFVTTHESFRLPSDVIARFNLKSRWVRQGLLLGTGPIVDPQFSGTLSIPIHNFSSQFIEIAYLEPLIAVEFTKTLPALKSEGYVDNSSGSAKGNIKKYMNGVAPVDSSVFATIEETKRVTEETKKLNERQRKVLFWGSIGAVIASVVAIGGLLISLKGIVNDVNARIDGIHAVYNESKNDYKSMLDNVEKIRIRLREINELNNGLPPYEKIMHDLRRLSLDIDELKVRFQSNGKPADQGHVH